MSDTKTDPRPWVLCADGKAHYRLGGLMLCGKATTVANAIGTKPDRTFVGVDKKDFCRECQIRNVKRWARQKA